MLAVPPEASDKIYSGVVGALAARKFAKEMVDRNESVDKAGAPSGGKPSPRTSKNSPTKEQDEHAGRLRQASAHGSLTRATGTSGSTRVLIVPQRPRGDAEGSCGGSTARSDDMETGHLGPDLPGALPAP